jgi:drug/metabolite transporter (DMT)-like permease
MLGILLVVLGIIAASGLLTLKKSKRKISRGPAFALFAALVWGIGFALLAQAIKSGDWQIVSVVEFSFVTITLLVLIPFIKGTEVISLETVKQGFLSKFVLGASLIQLLGVVALNLGISKSTASGGAVITAISACYPILTIFLALKHFEEEVKVVPLLGAFVGIFGVVILSFG